MRLDRLVLSGATLLALALLVGPAHAGERLTDAHLAPAPVYDSGSGVPDPAGFFTTEHTAVSYRNVEEVFPTRRVAAGGVPSPLIRDKPIDVHYQ